MKEFFGKVKAFCAKVWEKIKALCAKVIEWAKANKVLAIVIAAAVVVAAVCAIVIPISIMNAGRAADEAAEAAEEDETTEEPAGETAITEDEIVTALGNTAGLTKLSYRETTRVGNQSATDVRVTADGDKYRVVSESCDSYVERRADGHLFDVYIAADGTYRRTESVSLTDWANYRYDDKNYCTSSYLIGFAIYVSYMMEHKDGDIATDGNRFSFRATVEDSSGATTICDAAFGMTADRRYLSEAEVEAWDGEGNFVSSLSMSFSDYGTATVTLPEQYVDDGLDEEIFEGVSSCAFPDNATYDITCKTSDSLKVLQILRKDPLYELRRDNKTYLYDADDGSVYEVKSGGQQVEEEENGFGDLAEEYDAAESAFYNILDSKGLTGSCDWAPTENAYCYQASVTGKGTIKVYFVYRPGYTEVTARFIVTKMTITAGGATYEIALSNHNNTRPTEINN